MFGMRAAAAPLFTSAFAVALRVDFIGGSCICAFVHSPKRNDVCTTTINRNRCVGSTALTHLFGLAEWREKPSSAFVPDKTSVSSIRSIFMLPFTADNVLLPGQNTTIVLKEGRFYDLFQDCIDGHSSIVGMALMGDDGLLDVMSLCEIVDFDVEAGYRGKVTVTVTLVAVGRARLMELTQMKPVMMGTCQELLDEPMSEQEERVACCFSHEIEHDLKFMSSIEGVDMRQTYYDAVELVQAAAGCDACSVTESVMAESWAILACMSDKSVLPEALSLTSVTDRFDMASKALGLHARFCMIDDLHDDADFQ